MMRKIGRVKRALLKTLDFLFPSLMNIIWSIYFLVDCHRNGYKIFVASDEKEALDYLVE
jgi:hypothetical protein